MYIEVKSDLTGGIKKKKKPLVEQLRPFFAFLADETVDAPWISQPYFDWLNGMAHTYVVVLLLASLSSMMRLAMATVVFFVVSSFLSQYSLSAISSVFC